MSSRFPLLNTLSSLVLNIPLDRGGAAMEIEAVDPQTGRQLATLTPDGRAPVTTDGSVSASWQRPKLHSQG